MTASLKGCRPPITGKELLLDAAPSRFRRSTLAPNFWGAGGSIRLILQAAAVRVLGWDYAAAICAALRWPPRPTRLLTLEPGKQPLAREAHDPAAAHQLGSLDLLTSRLEDGFGHKAPWVVVGEPRSRLTSAGFGFWRSFLGTGFALGDESTVSSGNRKALAL